VIDDKSRFEKKMLPCCQSKAISDPPGGRRIRNPTFFAGNKISYLIGTSGDVVYPDSG